jgi:predicted nucleotidyltransferase
MVTTPPKLKQLLGMDVDVLTPNSLPVSFRDQVMREALAI